MSKKKEIQVGEMSYWSTRKGKCDHCGEIDYVFTNEDGEDLCEECLIEECLIEDDYNKFESDEAERQSEEY